MPQFNELQKEVLSELSLGLDIQDYDKGNIPEFIFVIQGINSSVAETALGKIGKKLIEFINSVDLDHPDLPCVINGIFRDDTNFRQQVQDVLDLADKCKHLSSIAPNFHKLIERNKFSKAFLHNKFGIRLYKSKKNQDIIRKKQKMQTVDLKAVCKNGNEVWNSQPTSFKVYNRHSMPYLKEIKSSEEKIYKYADLGCNSIVDKITEQVKQLKINLSYRYCGFNRVTMTTASAILARMHGYKLRTAWDIHDNQVVSIIIPSNLLYNLVPDDSDLPAIFIPHCLDGSYHYEVRAYPVHQIPAPESMLELVDHLDNFPDMNGKSLFDNLIVLVPSVRLHDYNGTYFIRDLKGNTLGFDRQEAAATFLDKTLIENSLVQPVLLGERDSICYFICYWR